MKQKTLSKEQFQAIEKALKALIKNPTCHSATVFTPCRARICKIYYGKNLQWDGELRVTLGKPNYLERKELKDQVKGAKVLAFFTYKWEK